MKCLQCGGGLEYVQNAQFARCSHCCSLFKNDNRHLSPIGPPDPDGSAAYAAQLGFAPRKANFTVVGMGGVNLKINTGKMERDLTNKVSSMIWGWVIGAIIIGVMVVVGVGVGIWVYMQSKSMSTASASGTPKSVTWDGTSPFSCGGADIVKLEKVKATLTTGTAITAAGNCQLTLVNVDVAAPLPIEATGNAKVTVTGGSLKGAPDAIVAGANAQVTVAGATVTGKAKSSGNGKILGVK